LVHSRRFFATQRTSRRFSLGAIRQFRESPAKGMAPTVTAVAVPTKALPGTALTNADVLKLKAAGLVEQLINDKIKASPASFNLDTNDIVELKQAGLPDAIIGAMIQASQR
jgi:hypothetical protein